MGTYLHGAGTLGWVVWSRVGIPPDFYLPHVDVGPPILHLHASLLHYKSLCLSTLLHLLHISVSPPLLPAWMNVAWLLEPLVVDFHTAQFSDNSGWYLFCSLVVISDVVVQGGKMCLPTPLF